MDDATLQFYSRHLLLNEWGAGAQDKLATARVLIIGAGGLGCPAAHLLAAAGVGQITIADGDTVEASNLQRQYLHTVAFLGLPKVDSIRAAVLAINPRCVVHTIKQRLAGSALNAAVAAADLVLDCTDNITTRHAINRACVTAKKPLVSGAAIRFDGQWSVFDAGSKDSPCYACVFPEAATPEDAADGSDTNVEDADRCGVMGVFAPLTHRVGNEQASAAIRLITGVGAVSLGELTLHNALDGSQYSLKAPRRADCAVCGVRPAASDLNAYLIKQSIDTAGFVPFDVWMNAALYAPQIGYYTSTRPVGTPQSGGDFITAPELSPVFGYTLARAIAPCFADGKAVDILECGAGTGALAASVIDGLAALSITVARYNILEISQSLRAQQASRLANYPCVRWLDRLPDTISGVVLANELLDALPVRAFTARGDQIFERGVSWQGGTWVWAERVLTAAQAEPLHRLVSSDESTHYTDYQFELGEQASAWVTSVAQRLAAGTGGAMVLIDYGFPQAELYHPQRAGGTLMAHRYHQASADVLAHATDADITAHVDFSAVAAAAMDVDIGAALELAGYTSQSRFLINAGVGEAFAALSADSSTIEQAQANRALQLMMSEAEMGELFKVIAFTHRCPAPLGFERGNRSHGLIEGQSLV